MRKLKEIKLRPELEAKLKAASAILQAAQKEAAKIRREVNDHLKTQLISKYGLEYPPEDLVVEVGTCTEEEACFFLWKEDPNLDYCLCCENPHQRK